MSRCIWKVAAGTVLSVAILAASAGDALAGWRWHGSSGGSSGGSTGGSSGGWGSSGGYASSGGGWGSSGGWATSGGSSGGGWGSSGGGHRHHRGLFHHKRAAWGGSSGGYGSSGGSSGGWGSSGGGSSGGWGSSGGSYNYAPNEIEMQPGDPSLSPMNPVLDPNAAPAPNAPEAPLNQNPGAAPGAGRDTSFRRADGLLMVAVPQDAKIFVNGSTTSSTGDMRQYISRDLQRGFNYTYEVKAEVVRDGKTIEQVKTVNVRAGETANLAFDFEAAKNVETSLTIRVPADAKVYLAGNKTNATGEVRVFRTTGLTEGAAWSDYTIRVEMEVGGRTLSEEKQITLKAGDTKEFEFEFDGEKVAAR